MLTLTMHALKRLKQRGISKEAVVNAIMYGAEKFCRGCIVYILKKNITRKLFKTEGIDIRKHGGIKVVMGTDNSVLTVCRCE